MSKSILGAPLRAHLIAAGVVTVGLLIPPAQAAEKKDDTKTSDSSIVLDEISVTATREERRTKEVPSAIDVVGKKQLEKRAMLNVKDGLASMPGVLISAKNGGYDSRLVIRGAGVKAAYGIREVMVMRDGVPMTDPDSFTRMDFVDTQDIERVEVTKGPGSIYGAGSTGGVVQILSKSVFESEDRARVGYGSFGTVNLHTRNSYDLSDNQAVSLTFSHRSFKNGWRRNNNFESSQVSGKYGYTFDDGATLESELAYTAANLELPGSMGETDFADYMRDGKQYGTKDAWKNSARDSKTFFFNSRYEGEVSDTITVRPRVYGTHWSHFHPVSGAINDSPHNILLGTDLEGSYRHALWGPSSLVAGVTLREDISISAKKYAYRNVTTGFGGRISATLNNNKGDLLSKKDSSTLLTGLFVQESVRPAPGLLIDVGLRYDRSRFDIEEHEDKKYDYATGTYIAGAGTSITDTTFNLTSAKVGSSYALTEEINLFGSVAQSDQVPFSTELETNPSLKAATSRNFEIGLKGRAPHWGFDTSVYYNTVSDDIVSVVDNNSETNYQNAGKTRRIGFEATGQYEVVKDLNLGGNYAFSRYEYEKFTEVANSTTTSRDGKQVPYVPEHRYTLFADYDFGSGFSSRVETQTWGEYFMDNANTKKYKGFKWATSLYLGYELDQHKLSLNVENLFDKRYATEAKRDTSGTDSYAGAEPRTVLLTYRYNF